MDLPYYTLLNSKCIDLHKMLGCSKSDDYIHDTHPKKTEQNYDYNVTIEEFNTYSDYIPKDVEMIDESKESGFEDIISEDDSNDVDSMTSYDDELGDFSEYKKVHLNYHFIKPKYLNKNYIVRLKPGRNKVEYCDNGYLQKILNSSPYMYTLEITHMKNLGVKFFDIDLFLYNEILYNSIQMCNKEILVKANQYIEKYSIQFKETSFKNERKQFQLKINSTFYNGYKKLIFESGEFTITGPYKV